MDGQLIVVGMLIAASTLFVVRSIVRAVRGHRSGCGSGCGKCRPSTEPTTTEGRISLPTIG